MSCFPVSFYLAQYAFHSGGEVIRILMVTGPCEQILHFLEDAYSLGVRYIINKLVDRL
jgi:hypothetical protein